jgi:hypothetical protein
MSSIEAYEKCCLKKLQLLESLRGSAFKVSIIFIVNKITSIFKEYSSVRSFELEDCSLDLKLKNLVKTYIDPNLRI